MVRYSAESSRFDPQRSIARLVRRGEALRSAGPQPATAGPAPVSTTARLAVLFGPFVAAVMAVAMAYC